MEGNGEVKTYAHFGKDVKLEVEVVRLPEQIINFNKPHLTVPHRTNFYHVFLFGDCSPVHSLDFQSVEIVPYSMLFVGKGQVHNFDVLTKYSGYELIFTEEFYSFTEQDNQEIKKYFLYNDLLKRNLLLLDQLTFAKYQTLVEAIDSEIKQPIEVNKNQILKNCIHNLLLLAQRESASAQIDHIHYNKLHLSTTLRFSELVEKQYKENKSVVEYSKQLSITEKKLGQATKLVLGKLPKDLIDDRVLLEAKRLLTHSELTVKEIGFELGFDEPSNFTKFFKKYTECTPLEFKSV